MMTEMNGRKEFLWMIREVRLLAHAIDKSYQRLVMLLLSSSSSLFMVEK